MYTVGTGIYGLYLCLTNGTFQAITYDILAQEGNATSYAKHQGASYGAVHGEHRVASPLGGFMANSFGYRSTYYWSAVVCAVNILLILSMHEPSFHKLAAKTKLRKHIGEASHVLLTNRTLFYPGEHTARRRHASQYAE